MVINMKFEELAHVRIKDKNVTGDVIEVYETKDKETRYIVESDSEGPIDDPDAWNDVRFPQFDCSEEQLELV